MPRRYTLALFAIAAIACSSDPGPPDATYDVRGQVMELHGSGEDRRVSIAHEKIPAFKDRAGTASEMPAMTMAFGIAPTVDAAAFTPQSKWEVRFEVRWKREPPLLITSAKRLPDDTALVLPESK